MWLLWAGQGLPHYMYFALHVLCTTCTLHSIYFALLLQVQVYPTVIEDRKFSFNKMPYALYEHSSKFKNLIGDELKATMVHLITHPHHPPAYSPRSCASTSRPRCTNSLYSHSLYARVSAVAQEAFQPPPRFATLEDETKWKIFEARRITHLPVRRSYGLNRRATVSSHSLS